MLGSCELMPHVAQLLCYLTEKAVAVFFSLQKTFLVSNPVFTFYTL